MVDKRVGFLVGRRRTVPVCWYEWPECGSETLQETCCATPGGSYRYMESECIIDCLHLAVALGELTMWHAHAGA